MLGYDDEINELARKVRGNPELAGTEDLSGLAEVDWLYLVSAH